MAKAGAAANSTKENRRASKESGVVFTFTWGRYRWGTGVYGNTTEGHFNLAVTRDSFTLRLLCKI